MELLAEKVRALAQRCRPHDLYDIVHVYRHPDLLGQAGAVAATLDHKCAHVGITVPNLDSILGSPFRREIQAEWANMLNHQIPRLPPFAQFWDTLGEVFDWLSQRVTVPALPRLEIGQPDPAWTAPRCMSSWRAPAQLELIRFAGANRLKVELGYQVEQGRQDLRVVEPCSLRRTQSGDLALFAINAGGELCSYRVDRIISAQVTAQPFTPQYLVEF